MNIELRNALLAMKHQLDTAAYDGQALEPLDNRYGAPMRSLHGRHANQLNEIIDEFGWPSVELVGEEGAFAAWLIAQYASEWPSLQRKFLTSLSGAAARGEVTQRQLAFLLDRVRFNLGQPQLYGTFLDWTKQGKLGAELEDSARVDEYRQAVGLPNFEITCQRQLAETQLKGGKAPSDFAAYKAHQQQWAQQLGWR